MDQIILVANIGKHLDSLETLFNSVILLAIAIAWAGIQRSQIIEVLGTKFNRRYAFFVAAALYLVVNMSILVLFLRLGDLVALLDNKNLAKGITQIATHRWILNPFGYFGSSTIAQMYSSGGLGLLISIWWLCNASLSSLMDDKKNRAANILFGLFLIIGLVSMSAIHRVHAAVLSALSKTDPGLYDLVLQTSGERTIGAFLGIVVGGLIFFAVNFLQRKWLPGIKTTETQQEHQVDS